MTDTYHRHVRKEIFPYVPRGGVLLDVGGGIGATAAALRRDGVVERAGVVDLVAPATGHGLDFAFAGDLTDPALIERIAREEGPFDTILCLDVFEHLVDPWTLVGRLHRALKPGGMLVASIPNIRHYSALMPLLLRNKWELTDAGILDRTHLRFFVRDTAVSLMTSSGLELDKVAMIGGARKLTRLIDTVSLGRLRSFTALQYMVRARRRADDRSDLAGLGPVEKVLDPV